MLCVSASMPVAAVTCGGRPSVNSGSANTTLARIFALKTTRFKCVSFSLTTDERPTSEPVPEVVGSEGGFIVPEGDEAAAVWAVQAAVSFDRQAARARVERLFTVQRMAQEYLKVYQGMLS